MPINQSRKYGQHGKTVSYVNVFVSPQGVVTPTSIENEHGRTYPVKVKTRHEIGDTMRYTVLVSGREINLFRELNTNRWYALC